MLLVEQLDEDLLAHLHITGQSQDVLLSFRQALDRLVDVVLGVDQSLALLHQGDIGRMLTGIELLQLGFTEGQLIELFLNPDHGVQCRFRFERQINRLVLLTIRIEQLFRTVQVIFDLGQMGLQEIQALLGFFGLAQHVLLEIVLADVIEHSTNTSLVFPFQGQEMIPVFLPFSLT